MKAIFRARRLRLASGRASLATLSTALMIGAAFAAPAAAQDADAAQQSGAAIDEDAGVIIVTGFRASVENSIAAKRESNFIVDVVTADDIAGLPDVSIAESLARLPGVTSQRTGGQASAINIRGLSQDLVSATLNGREQVATSGNRVIEFDQYPSELISQAAVYKTPLASHIEGGIAGKVELKTVRRSTTPKASRARSTCAGCTTTAPAKAPMSRPMATAFRVRFRPSCLTTRWVSRSAMRGCTSPMSPPASSSSTSPFPAPTARPAAISTVTAPSIRSTSDSRASSSAGAKPAMPRSA